jgi:hypothetical protein
MVEHFSVAWRVLICLGRMCNCVRVQVGLVDENVLEECLKMEANTQLLIENGQW